MLSKLLPSPFHYAALLVVVMFTTVTPLVGVIRKIMAAGTKYRQTSMAAPGGAVGMSGSSRHRS
jgi:hypothetical protein